MPTQGHFVAVIRGRGFRRLLGVRLSSQFGDGLFQAGLAVSVFFNPTQEIEPVAYAVAFSALVAPYSLLGPYVGVLLDRWSRRNILVLANLVRAGLVLPAASTIYMDGSPWIYGTCAMLVIAINRFVLAGLSASQPHVVDERELVTANSVANTAGTIIFGVGLGTAYGLTVVTGDKSSDYGMVASTAVVGYLLAAVLTAKHFGVGDLGPDEQQRRVRTMRAEIADISTGMMHGFGHLWQRRGSAYAMALQAGHRLLYGVVTVTTLALFREHFHDHGRDDYDDTLAWLGLIAGVGNIGIFLAAVVTPKATRSLGSRTWLITLMVLVTGTSLFLSVSIVEWAFVVAVLLVNITSQGLKLVVDTSLQKQVDDKYRGRIFSLNDTVFNIFFILGLFTGAAVLPTDGYAPELLFTVTGCYVVLMTAYSWASRDAAPYDRSPWKATATIATR